MATVIKRTLYVLYLLSKPLGVPYSWVFFLLAALCNLLQRFGFIGDDNAAKSQAIMHSLLDEDVLNLFLMVFLVCSGNIMQSAIHVCLFIWALMHASDITYGQDTLLSPVMDWVHHSKVELNQIKCNVEVLICFCAFPSVFVR